MVERTRFMLDEARIPRTWYNIAADLPVPQFPPLHPGTHQPLGPDDLAPLFPMALIMQEVSTERDIEIPDPVRELYKQYRPSPLVRALRLEKALDTPAHIYYKYEGGSPAGSHKPNTAIPQAFYNKEAGITRIATETGAGQWGSALAHAGAMFGIEVKVYMVRASFDQKPYRRLMMETYGASVVASPSMDTNAGRAILAEHPGSTGSLGIAISEAVEDAVMRDDTHYALGSVLNHVMLHQTVIGIESIEQMEMAGEEPDVIIACAGGGSNFAGLAFPWVGRTFRGGRKYRVIAVEPEAAPSMTRGRYAYDYGDTAKMAPVVKMYPWPRLHPGADPCRRPSLPRHVAAGEPAQARRLHRGPQRPSAAVLRGGRPVRQDGRPDPGAGVDARHPRRDRRSARSQEDRREEGHPLQPVRPRLLRHDVLPALSQRSARGLRVSGRRGQARSGGGRGLASR
jgi:tryptophan synthase beta chain